MTERERGIALQLAKANTVAEAWDWQKQMLATQEGIDVKEVYGKRTGVIQDAASWEAGYKAGHSGQPSDEPPPGVDPLSWSSGIIEGKADREVGRVRPLLRKPPTRT